MKDDPDILFYILLTSGDSAMSQLHSNLCGRSVQAPSPEIWWAVRWLDRMLLLHILLVLRRNRWLRELKGSSVGRDMSRI